jgi:hypothetical protein
MAIDLDYSIFCPNGTGKLYQILSVHAFIFDPLHSLRAFKQLSLHFCNKLLDLGFIMRMLLDRKNQG